MQNSIYSLTPGPAILFGSGSVSLLPEKLKNFKRILLVTGNHFTTTEEYSRILESLREFSLSTISGIHAEVPLSDVDSVTETARKSDAQAIIAIGGGSVIDCAKAAAALAPLEGIQGLTWMKQALVRSPRRAKELCRTSGIESWGSEEGQCGRAPLPPTS